MRLNTVKEYRLGFDIGHRVRETACHFEPFGDAQDKLREKSFFSDERRNRKDLSLRQTV